jgi:hypothetical protein
MDSTDDSKMGFNNIGLPGWSLFFNQSRDQPSFPSPFLKKNARFPLNYYAQAQDLSDFLLSFIAGLPP